MRKFIITKGMQYLFTGNENEVKNYLNNAFPLSYSTLDTDIAIDKAKDVSWLGYGGTALLGILDNHYRITLKRQDTRYLVLDNRRVRPVEDYTKPFAITRVGQHSTIREMIHSIKIHGRMPIMTDKMIRFTLRNNPANKTLYFTDEINIVRL